MNSTLGEFFDRLERLYENIYNLCKTFQEASDNNFETQYVTLVNADGSTETVEVNSFQRLQSEINRISANFDAITNANNIAYILNSDGSISEYVKTTFMNAQFVENISSNTQTCIVDNNSNIADFIYPLVKIPITIADDILKSSICCRSFEISADTWANVPDNPTYLQLQNLISNGTVIVERELNRSLSLEKEQVKFWGKFEIMNTTSVPNTNDFNIKLNKVKYQGLYVNGANIDLRPGDILVSASGSSKYKINTVSLIDLSVNVTKIAGGSEVPTVGNYLYYNEIINTDENIVAVPVRPQQRLVIFLSTENITAISYPGTGIKIDTSDFTVAYRNNTYTIDEFFSNYVTNISEYLLNMVEENSIPFSLGIKPKKPELLESNFKVIQINRHITKSKTVLEINKLNNQKQTIQNEIDAKEKKVKDLLAEIETGNYTSSQQKQEIVSEIQNLRSEISTMNANILTISRNIDNNAINNSLKDVKPKYRIVGFWSLNEDSMYSPVTGVQHIVKYEVQYRYLNQTTDVVEDTSFNMVDNGNAVSVTFSPWNDLQTTALTKVKNIDGSVTWETQSLSSTDDININQCIIPITENESVEIRVRAISEAGYPVSPVKSEWSDILRVDFPDELKYNNINSVLTKNSTDLANAEFKQILQNMGLLDHISGQVQEAEKTYHHTANMITSGQYTAELKNIPLDECIKLMLKDIDSLKQTMFAKATVEIQDFDGDVYNVSNGNTIDLFAGNYSDIINVSEEDSFGSIVRKKALIKISNNNQVPIEIKSLKPYGSESHTDQFGNIIYDDYIRCDINYAGVPINDVKNSMQHLISGDCQKIRQIIYFRNVDISMTQVADFQLYEDDALITPTDASGIVTVGTTDNVIYKPSGGQAITGYIDFSNNSYNPNLLSLYQINNEFPNINGFYDVELERLSKMSRLLRKDIKQNKLITGQVNGIDYPFYVKKIDLGFQDVDKYAIGANTCGAFLYPQFDNIDRFTTSGNASDSSLVLEPGQTIEIPIIFEFRMMDRLGNIYDYDSSPNITNVTYKKKIGVDLMINGGKMSFDISATANFKSNIRQISRMTFRQ